MYGAILGDMIGAPYEFDRGNKTKDFEMFNDRVCFTDDSVMTIAVADALMRISNDADDDDVKTAVIQSMQKWGKKYPRAGEYSAGSEPLYPLERATLSAW